MGSLFGREGRNETDGRRGEVAKKSASLLAAVAVAGGSAVVGLPQAEAAYWAPFFYFEKIDENGEPLGGSSWKFTIDERDDSNPHLHQIRHRHEGVAGAVPPSQHH